ncbi:MAG: hypothetical protein IMHGJWDQ_001548 [Candidatus Fervidibacter sp.]
MPTVRFALAVALGVLFWGLGWELVAWAYNALLLALAVWEWGVLWWVKRQVRCEREVEAALELAAETSVALLLSNPTNMPLVVFVKDEVPTDFEWRSPLRYWGQQRPLLATLLPPRSRSQVTYIVRPLRRGAFRFGAVHARLSTPLQFCWLPQRWDLPQTVRVLPNLSQARKYLLLLRKMRLREFGFRPVPLRGAGTEFASLRDYLPDDDPRWIDWNATARRGKLVSKEFELERGQNIVAVVDVGRVMATRLDTLTKLDYAVNAAAFVLFLAYRMDDRVGLMVFAQRVLQWLPPAKGVRQWEAILETLRQAEPNLVEADYAGAFTHLLRNLPRRSLLLLFTDLIDPDTSEALIAHAQLLAEKHLVVVVALSDYELRTLLTKPPEEAADLYRQAAAIAVWNERRRAIAQLRGSGIMVLDTAPEDLFEALLEHYLLAKKRL